MKLSVYTRAFLLIPVLTVFLSCSDDILILQNKERSNLAARISETRQEVSESKQPSALEQYLKAVNVEYNTGFVYYVTEMQGCGFCIEQSIEYAREMAGHKKVIFLFSSAKIEEVNTKRRLGSLLEEANILMESNDYAHRYGVTQSKPTAFFIGKNGVEKFEFTPDNFLEGFSKIRDFEEEI